MPTVFTKNGFRFFFFSNEHLPIHIHIQGKGGEAKYDMENEKVIYNRKIKPADLKKAVELAKDHIEDIENEWNKRFNEKV